MIRNLIGERYKDMTIISYRSYQDVDVQFDSGYIAKNIQYMNFKVGSVKNLFKPEKFEIGYVGGEVLSWEAYYCWASMIQRCYDPKRLKIRPDYLGCSVDEKWHNFQNFQEFYLKKYKNGFQLDKDLILIDNKIYSEDTCSFVPHQINVLIGKKGSRGTREISPNYFSARISIDGKRKHIGVFKTESDAFLAYKKAKEEYIKTMAERYKSVIDERVYITLINLKI